jgi:drug/metabolite transporter (DMT)-like permease
MPRKCEAHRLLIRLIIAYIGVVLIWATTPLAIKWSGEGPGFLFGVAARMTIGFFCLFFVLLIAWRRLPWNRKARLTYLAIAVQIYGAMLSTYWGSQFIPSGWISVIFGLTPLITAVFASFWLGERSLTWDKSFAYLMGLAGLVVMFFSAIQLNHDAVLGIAAILLAAFLQALSSVWVKQIGARIASLFQVSGGLLLALPAYMLTWWGFDGDWPQSFPLRSWMSIVYLGVIATTFGFILYYYLLSHLSATRVALITFLTPVLSLMIGHVVNHEQVTMKVFVGTICILFALFLHVFGGRLTTLPAKLK